MCKSTKQFVIYEYSWQSSCWPSRGLNMSLLLLDSQQLPRRESTSCGRGNRNYIPDPSSNENPLNIFFVLTTFYCPHYTWPGRHFIDELSKIRRGRVICARPTRSWWSQLSAPSTFDANTFSPATTLPKCCLYKIYLHNFRCFSSVAEELRLDLMDLVRIFFFFKGRASQKSRYN